MNDPRKQPSGREKEIHEESTDGNMGPTGSGGVASQSPSPGHRADDDDHGDEVPGTDEEE